MSEKFLLKDIFTQEMVSYISANIKKVHPSFEDTSFVECVMKDFKALSFSQRAEHIAKQLHLFLPSSYLQAIDIIENSLGPAFVEEELEGFDCFYVMPLGIYVKHYGVKDYDRSMQALKEMTKRFSSEWPIRCFIEEDEARALYFLNRWLQDDNCHVRRLVSEGTRPRLPMGTQLKAYIKDPDPVLKLLEKLKDEPTRLVQRSIANSLNDISKDHPSKVTDFLARWKEDKVKDIDWIISHACRCLIKEGNTKALVLMGYKEEPKIKDISLKLQSTSVTLGEPLSFILDFELEEDTRLMIDYLIYFKKANGSLKAKVFKLSSKLFKQGHITIEKRHLLKAISTRKYYEGIQAVSIQINAKRFEFKEEFLT